MPNMAKATPTAWEGISKERPEAISRQPKEWPVQGSSAKQDTVIIVKTTTSRVVLRSTTE